MNTVIVVLSGNDLIGVYTDAKELSHLVRFLIQVHKVDSWEEIKDKYEIYWPVLVNNARGEVADFIQYERDEITKLDLGISQPYLEKLKSIEDKLNKAKE